MPYGLQLVVPPSGEPIGLVEARLHTRFDADDTTQDPLLQAWITAAREYAENVTGRQLVSATWNMTLDRFPTLFRSWSWGNPYGDGLGAPYLTQGANQWDWNWTLDGKTIRVPRPPLQAVGNIAYIDGSGNLVPTLAASNYQVSTAKEPGLIAPTYGIPWPFTQAQYDAVTVTFTAGYGPQTTIAAGVNAGTQTVTPGTMLGVYPGTVLVIDQGNTTGIQETVVVSSVTATTFTATFQKTHAANCTVSPGMPESIRRAMLLLISHWNENREDTIAGTITSIPKGVDALLATNWTGEMVG